MKKRLLGLVLGLAMVASVPTNVSANTLEMNDTASPTASVQNSSESETAFTDSTSDSSSFENNAQETTTEQQLPQEPASPSIPDSLTDTSEVPAGTEENTTAPTATTESENAPTEAKPAQTQKAARSSVKQTQQTATLKTDDRALNQYVTIKAGTKLITDLDMLDQETSVANIQTLQISKIYAHSNGKDYFALQNNKKQLVGYIETTGVKYNASAQGDWQKDSAYATVSKNYNSYSNFSWQVKNSSATLLNKTYKITGKYIHFNGSTYYSMENHKGTWIGYINAAAVKRTTDAQGAWQKDSAYATVSKNYNSYSSFSWQVKNSGATLLNKTYKITGKYIHSNGSTYYSMENNKGTWIGYINAAAVKRSTGAQGAWQAESRYVTVMKNYQSYKNFDKWTVSKSASALKHRTYKVTGKYSHFNGSTYYSMQDNKKNWIGYINATATYKGKGPQGYYISCNKNVKIISKNYNLYSNFDWKVKGNTKNRLNRPYVAKTMYRHFNGSLYYSLYTPGGSWIGYLNATAVK